MTCLRPARFRPTFSRLAFAAALAAAGTAHAQSSVTLYGLLDTYVEWRNHSNAAGDSRVALNSGGMNTSRWGLRGTEDLGGGLKAVFQLESEVGADTGAAGAAFWSRQANVGLEGGFGRVVAGRSYSTTYDFILPFDPMGYAPVNSWATAGNATATAAGVNRADGMLTGVSNLVKYRGTAGPVSFGATYRFGEQTSFNDGNAAMLAVGYNDGPLGLVATAEQVNGLTGANGRRDRTRTYHLGASYQVGPAKLFAVVRSFDRALASGAASLESRTAWIGAAYAASPALTLTAAYYHQDIRSGVRPGDDPKLLTLRARYALSKRTDLYAVAGHAKARSGAVGVSRDDAGFLGAQSNLAAGIQHRF